MAPSWRSWKSVASIIDTNGARPERASRPPPDAHSGAPRLRTGFLTAGPIGARYVSGTSVRPRLAGICCNDYCAIPRPPPPPPPQVGHGSKSSGAPGAQCPRTQRPRAPTRFASRMITVAQAAFRLFARTRVSTAAALCSGARCAYRSVIAIDLCPSNSRTVLRSTPAMTSLLANV
jgi:hypothetical protein